MKKYLLPINLVLATAFLSTNVLGLPAPSTLDARERRLNATTPTPTPPAPAQIQTQAPALPSRTQMQAAQTPSRVQMQTQAPPPRAQVRPQTQTRSAAPPEGSRPSTTVVIDAGHGGHDRGGIAGQRVPEKTMALDVAQRLKAVLQSYGYRVVMTRDSDIFIPLGTRVAIANSYRDAVFVCVHFNATSRRSASGIETYFYSSQSLPLASAIHYYVAGGAPSSNRGVRRRGFYVLRNTRIPAVLVECGFLTNPTEAQYAQSSTYRQKLADEIARGVRERGMVSSSRYATSNATVPLQPFIDQTHYREPRSKRKRSSKRSRSTSSKRKKSSESTSTASKKRKKSSSASTED